MQLIDLSVNVCMTESEPYPVAIEYIDHQQGASILGKEHGLTHKDFPDEMAISLEVVTLTTHTGTHIDAPLHYGPMSAGEESCAITDLPLEWFFGDGVVLDCRSKESSAITQDDIISALESINYQLKPKDIVLIRTDADKYWLSKDYLTHYRGMSAQATRYLVEQGINVIGIDSFGFDAPFHRMLNDYVNTRDKSKLWPAHLYGREMPYCQIEKLANLDSIPIPYGFKIYCPPVKIEKAGAGWCRAVALVE